MPVEMAYWLFKSEPGTWSWDDQVEKGEKGEEWDGVRNHSAKLNMLAMRRGDLGFFYHSVDEKSIVGVVKVIAEAHPDSTDKTNTWFCVDIAAESPLPRPVSLAEIKREPRLAGMALVKQSRLSVQPVTEQEWEIICTMAQAKKATKTASKPAAKTAAKAPAKAKTASAAATKAPAKTAAKSAAKKPAAKTATKTAAKPAASAAKKPASKTAAKPAAKKAPAKKAPAKSAKK
jgi:predicted RNA-binding protein with PUA-like domain